MKVAGTVMVVIGGGNGIGREVVFELLRRGARVAAVDLRQDSLDETVRLVDADADAIERVIDVNLYGTLHTVRAFLPHLLERPVAHVANVSSMGGFLPVPGQTIYGASKAAVRLMTEGLYAELLDTTVGMSVVFPGAVRTDITANSGVDIPGAASSAEAAALPTTAPGAAARTIVDGIEKDRLHIDVGRDARLMNLLHRLAPRRSTHLIQRQMKGLLDS